MGRHCRIAGVSLLGAFVALAALPSAASAQGSVIVPIVPIVPVTPVGPGASTPTPAPGRVNMPPPTVPQPSTSSPANTMTPGNTATAATTTTPVSAAPTNIAAPSSDATVQTPAPAVRKLDLSFANDGTMTLIADNVTIRDIIAEWERVGHTKFVDGDKMPGGVVTFEFKNQPELAVLRSVLHGASGWASVPRPMAGGQSGFDRVIVLPVSRGSAAGFVPPMSMSPVPGANGMPDQELPPITPPQMSAPRPQPAPPTSSALPSAGQTSSTPGVIIAPVTPVTPVKPGGGGGGGGR